MINIYDKKNKVKAFTKRFGFYILIGFLIINIIVPVILVYNKMGIYQRPDEISKVAVFLRDNQGTEKYGCVAQVHDKTFAFYTGKVCARWEYINVSWLEEQTHKEDLKYFVINLYQENTGILNKKFFKDLEDEMPEIYEWLINNTIDITEETGLDKDNNYFRVREFKK